MRGSDHQPFHLPREGTRAVRPLPADRRQGHNRLDRRAHPLARLIEGGQELVEILSNRLLLAGVRYVPLDRLSSTCAVLGGGDESACGRRAGRPGGILGGGTTTW